MTQTYPEAAFAGPDEPADCTAVVITYNSARDLGGLLDSLPAAAAGLRVRVVVVDNDSTDDVAAVARRYPGVVFVAAGGNLLVLLNPDAIVQPGWGEAIRRPWGGEWSAALPGTIGPIVDRAGEAGGTLAWIDYDHPVFDVFNAPRSGDFATARFLRYRRLTIRADSAHRTGGVADTASGSHVLARFDDGIPALVEQRVGRGKVLI